VNDRMFQNKYLPFFENNLPLISFCINININKMKNVALFIEKCNIFLE
jgi:hypothetical protein